ncbi:MAG: hypothetical protein KKE50_05905 [Nanoarchaeota archaeon]|nr:hypothetical protein [Nanoarchaeota archaeon]
MKKTLLAIALAGISLVGCYKPRNQPRDGSIYSASLKNLTGQIGEIDINKDGLADQFVSESGIDLRISNESHQGDEWGSGIIQFEYSPDGKTFRARVNNTGINQEGQNQFRKIYPIEAEISNSGEDRDYKDFLIAEGKDELNSQGRLAKRTITYNVSEFKKFTRTESFSSTGRLTQALIRNRLGEVVYCVQFNPLSNKYECAVNKLGSRFPSE